MGHGPASGLAGGSIEIIVCPFFFSSFFDLDAQRRRYEIAHPWINSVDAGSPPSLVGGDACVVVKESSFQMVASLLYTRTHIPSVIYNVYDHARPIVFSICQ